MPGHSHTNPNTNPNTNPDPNPNTRPGANPSLIALTSRDGPMGVATSLPPKRSLWPKKHASYRGLEIAVRVRVRVSFSVRVGIRVKVRVRVSF